MRKLLGCAAVAIVTALGGLAIPAVATAADAAIGTWALNVSKSALKGPAPKSDTRTYSQAGQSISLVIQTVGADGKEEEVRMTYQPDGQDYPVTGSPNFDAISATQIDSDSIRYTVKREGRVVGTGSRTMSKDGKTLTLKIDGGDVRVYDKQ
jgi:hypothetical protein